LNRKVNGLRLFMKLEGGGGILSTKPGRRKSPRKHHNAQFQKTKVARTTKTAKKVEE